MVERESYMKIAQEAFDKGFITFSSFARNIYKKNIEDFLEFYKENYDNAFTKKIEIINDIHIINSKEELTNKRRIFAKV